MPPTARRALAAICLTLAALPASAGAQLPFPPEEPPPEEPSPTQPEPPREPRDRSRAHNLPAPRGDAPAYGANNSRTGEASAPSVFGPMRLSWAVSFPGAVNQPLIVGKRVFVNAAKANDYGSHVYALSARTGRLLWRKRTPGTYFSSPIAAGSGIVVSANTDGVVRAFRIRDGRRLWVRKVNRVNAAPAVAGGTVFVQDEYGLSARTGKEIWAANGGGSAFSDVALDRRRVYVASHCGAAKAFERADGDLVWRHSPATCPAGAIMVAGGRVYSGDARYVAATGRYLGDQLPDEPEAISRGLGYSTLGHDSRYEVSAFRLKRPRRVWTHTTRFRWSDYGAPASAPLVVGGTLYAALPKDNVAGFDLRRGRVLSLSPVPVSGPSSVGGIRPGLAAGAGHLFLADGSTLKALSPKLNPGRGRVDLASDVNHVRIGRTVHLAAAVGGRLRRTRPRLTVQGDVFPFGPWNTIRRGRPRKSDGALYVARPTPRNARYRVQARGRRSRVVKVFANPRYGFSLRAVSPSVGMATLRVRGPRSRHVRGLVAIAYYRDGGSRVYRRAGTARLRPRGRRASRARITFRIPPGPTGGDLITLCVNGMARRGYGHSDLLGRRCGRSRLTIGRGGRTRARRTTRAGLSWSATFDADAGASRSTLGSLDRSADRRRDDHRR